MDARTIRDLVKDLVCETYFETRFERKDPKTISVTEVTQCLRYSYFTRKQPRCVPQVMSLLMGVQGHRLFLSKLQRYGFIVEKLVIEKREGIKLVGRCDAWHPDLDIVIELKTCSKAPDKPYDDHVFQVRIYGEMLRARKLYIVYVPRDTVEGIQVFEVYPKSVLDKAFERAIELSKAIELDDPPSRDSGRWCRYCPYAFECRSADGRFRKRSKRLTKWIGSSSRG